MAPSGALWLPIPTTHPGLLRPFDPPGDTCHVAIRVPEMGGEQRPLPVGGHGSRFDIEWDTPFPHLRDDGMHVLDFEHDLRFGSLILEDQWLIQGELVLTDGEEGELIA